MEDDFLRAIEAEPTDRLLRLVFADWLDENDDSRGELIRAEEEMRELPVFADRFWELKLRRNELRAKVNSEWCGRMRYGTECEPVFRHGIPDGWRERWRLIREFTERWHKIPIPDVGGRQTEIAEAEKRWGGVLPPSVREWVAFAHDVQRHSHFHDVFYYQFAIDTVPGQPAVSILYSGPEGTNPSGTLFGIRDTDRHESDPPVCGYDYGEDYDEGNGTPFLSVNPTTGPVAESVTAFAFLLVVDTLSYSSHCFRNAIDDSEWFLEEAGRAFQVSVDWGGLRIFEREAMSLVVESPPRWPRTSALLLISPKSETEVLPAFVQSLIPAPSDVNRIPF